MKSGKKPRKHWLFCSGGRGYQDYFRRPSPNGGGHCQKGGPSGADHWADVSRLSDAELEEAAGKYTVFGRVLPEQKRTLVRAFQKQGHTVAMTGDGVNDVLALKDADCSIAVATGSDAARNASQLVLLDSNFSFSLSCGHGRAPGHQ